MNTKAEDISSDPSGIFECSYDPHVYNVASYSANFRIVDMCTFECSCPRRGKSFCSHIRAICKKYKEKYPREISNIFGILNDINMKNKRATCIDKPNNHLNLLIRGLNSVFYFRNILDISEIHNIEAKQRYSRVIYATLRALSGIFWRIYQSKDQKGDLPLIVHTASIVRNNISVKVLMDALDKNLEESSLGNDTSEANALKHLEIAVTSDTGLICDFSIVDIIESFLRENCYSNLSKQKLLRGIYNYLYNWHDVCEFNSYRNGESAKSDILKTKLGQKVLSIVQSCVKSSSAQVNCQNMINDMLIEQLGLNLSSIGIRNYQDILQDPSFNTKSGKNLNSVIFNATNLVSNLYFIRYINTYCDNNKSNYDMEEIIGEKEILRSIQQCPPMTDLNNYLFWFASNRYTTHGSLEDFIRKHENSEYIRDFFFLCYSASHIKKNGNSIHNPIMGVGNLRIIKLVKPIADKDGIHTTFSYGNQILNSIGSLDGVMIVNYLLAACIWENGVKNFIDAYPIDEFIRRTKLVIEDSSKTRNSFVEMLQIIIATTPPAFNNLIWEYIIIPVISLWEDQTIESTIHSLIVFFIECKNYFALNNIVDTIFNMLPNLNFNKSLELLNLQKKSGNWNMQYTIKDHEFSVKGKKNSVNSGGDYLLEKCSTESEGSESRYNIVESNLKIDENGIEHKTPEELVSLIQLNRFGIGIDSRKDPQLENILLQYSKLIKRTGEKLSENLYCDGNHFQLELIQNADDNFYEKLKYYQTSVPSLKFVTGSGGILVLNNEDGFTPLDIMSLSDLANSSKIDCSRIRRIGKFGLGFKSVFTITDTPYIFSNGFKIRFDAQSPYGAYIYPEWVSYEIIELIPKDLLDISGYEVDKSAWNTAIWLPFKAKKLTRIHLKPEFLLFTNKLVYLEHTQKDATISIKKCTEVLDNNSYLTTIFIQEYIHSKDAERTVKKRKLLPGEKYWKRQFLLVDYDISTICKQNHWLDREIYKNRQKKIVIGVELKADESTDTGVCLGKEYCDVFAFLPIRSYGFHFIIHADFELTSSREGIATNNEWNCLLRDCVPNALIHAIQSWRRLDNLPMLHKSFLSVIPLSNDYVDNFFAPIITKFHHMLKSVPCIYTQSGIFECPRNVLCSFNTYSGLSVDTISKIFPNIDELCFVLDKHCKKKIVCSDVEKYVEHTVFDDLGIDSINLVIIVTLIDGMIRDFSYFDRSFEWYIQIFTFLGKLIASSTCSGSYLQTLRNLPLFLTDKGEYVSSYNNKLGRNQLFLPSSELFTSIDAACIHFISKKLLRNSDKISNGSEYYVDIKNLNSFYNDMDIYDIKEEQYIEFILEKVTHSDSKIDAKIIIRLSSILNSFWTKKPTDRNVIILGVSSNEKILPLTSENFYIHEKLGNITNFVYILDFLEEETFIKHEFKYLRDTSRSKLSLDYLEFGDAEYWRDFFSLFGITELPFIIKKLNLNLDILDENQLMKHIKDIIRGEIDDSVLKKHMNDLIKLRDKGFNIVIDFYIEGLEDICELLKNCRVVNNQEKADLILVKFTEDLCKVVCSNWNSLSKFWHLGQANLGDCSIPNSYSLLAHQLQNASLFSYVKYITETSYSLIGISRPKQLTYCSNMEYLQIISPFVGLIHLEKNAYPIEILEFAFGVNTKINSSKYIFSILESICCDGNSTNLVTHTIKDISYFSLVALFDFFIYCMKSNNDLDINISDIFKKVCMIPVKLSNGSIIWKKSSEVYWEDRDKLISWSQPLGELFLHDKIEHRCRTTDFFSFFVTELGISLSPTDKQLLAELDNFQYSDKNNLDSEQLLSLIKIIVYLSNSMKFGSILEFPSSVLPIVSDRSYGLFDYKKKSFQLLFPSLSNLCILFSENFSAIAGEMKMLWSPFCIYINDNLAKFNWEEIIAIDNLQKQWYSLCLPITTAVYGHISSDQVDRDDAHFELSSFEKESKFYKELIANILGPLYEDSIDYISRSDHKDWHARVSKCKILILKKDISVEFNFFINKVWLASYYDNKADIIYIKHLKNLNTDDYKYVVASLLSFVSSFLGETSSCNLGVFKISHILINLVIKEVLKSSSFQISWSDIIVKLSKKAEISIRGYRFNLRHFLFNKDYSNDESSSEDFTSKCFESKDVVSELNNLTVNSVKLDRFLNSGPNSTAIDIGKFGEKAGFDYLSEIYKQDILNGKVAITWENECMEKGLPYDITINIISPLSREIVSTKYVEVKSSSSKDRKFFHITCKEWSYAQLHQDNYWILRVFGVRPSSNNTTNSTYKFTLIKNPYRYWVNGQFQVLLVT
ncbi:hypothetical protein ACR3K2_22200 [Cryptosporidium serpentis]